MTILVGIGHSGTMGSGLMANSIRQPTNKYVAVEIDGCVSVHLPSTTGNDYTLCGIDGDDPSLGQIAVDVPRRSKVDCPACYRIWRVSSKFNLGDFSPAITTEDLQ